MLDRIIRQATAEDAASISQLLNELGYSADETLVRQKVAEHARCDSSRAFVAVLNGEVIGAISVHVLPLFHAPCNLGRITSLVVSTAHRGQGTGRLLIETAEQFARDRECSRVEITTGSHRHAAHHFYAAVGYEVSEHKRLLKRF